MTSTPTTHLQSDSPQRQPLHRANQHRAWVPVAAVALVIGIAFVAIYVGLQRNPTPQRLPVAVVGGDLSSAVRGGLGDAVDVTRVGSRVEGDALVRRGDAVAVLAATSPTTLALDYSGASGMSESGAARRLAGGFAAKAGFEVDESDVVPLAAYDSAGLSTFYLVFGVTLSSFILAQGLTAGAAQVRLRHRLLVMTGFAALIGVVAATIAGPVYGSLTPSFTQMTLCLMLLSAACAFSTKALGAWLGPPGIGLAVLMLTVVGNATSGATIGFNLLPGWAQAISAETPQGAAVRALNGLGYYGGTDVVRPLVVLAAWFAVGLLLVVAKQRLDVRRERGGRVPA